MARLTGAYKWIVMSVLLLSLWAAAPVWAQDTTQEAQAPITVAPDLIDSAQQAYIAQDFDSALLDISLFILLNPTYSQGYFLRGAIYLDRGQEGDQDQGLTDLDQAIALVNDAISTPQYLAALYSTRGSAYAAKEDFESAFDDYQTALDIQPSVNLYVNRAILYAQQEDFDSALADVDAAIAFAEDAATDAGLYLFRANIDGVHGDLAAMANDYLSYAQIIGTDARQLDAISPGDVVTVAMATGRVYLIPFEAADGDQLSAIAIADEASQSQADPLLIVIDPAGTPIVANDDVSQTDLTSLVQDFPLTETGVYTLVVTHAGGTSDGNVLVQIDLG